MVLVVPVGTVVVGVVLVGRVEVNWGRHVILVVVVGVDNWSWWRCWCWVLSTKRKTWQAKDKGRERQKWCAK